MSRRTRRVRRVVPVAVLTVLVLVLTGCSGLPTDDAPRPGRPVLGQPLQIVQAQPDPPPVNATPTEIVRGFLQANVSFADSHEVARTYLTDELAASWMPADHVFIYDGDFELSTANDGVVEARASARADLDEHGRLAESPAETTRSERFALTRMAGQWRISEFPQQFGLWLSASDFERQFRTASIAYGSPVQNGWVPDVRWFPHEGLPTALARAVLDPVPDHLEGAVATGVSNGMELIAGAVPVDTATGTATVNLRGPGLSDNLPRTRLLWAQFVETLTQAGGVRSVDLQLNGQPLRVPGIDGPVSSAAQLGYLPVAVSTELAVLRSRDDLVLVDPTEYDLRNAPASAARQIELPQVDLRWQGLATDATLQEFAAVSSDRSTLWRWRAGQEMERSEIGRELTPPSYDRTGSLFVAGRSAAGPQVWALPTSGPLDAVARRLRAPWLQEGMSLEAFEVSPDAQQAAVLISDDTSGERTLAITGVLRDAEGTPEALTEPRFAAQNLQAVREVAWPSSTSLVVLDQGSGDEVLTPYQVPLNGWVEPLPPEPGAEHLRAVLVDEGFELFLVTRAAEIFSREGSGWYSYRNGEDLVVPAG